MQLIGHGLGIRVFVLIKLHGVPSVFAPPLPVLYYYAGLVVFSLEAAGVLKQLLLAVITLAAVNVAERPVRHCRNLSGQITVRTYDFIG